MQLEQKMHRITGIGLKIHFYTGMEVFMKEISEKVMRNMILEVLHVERKNLRSKAKTDQRMAEELAKIIVDYVRMSM